MFYGSQRPDYEPWGRRLTIPTHLIHEESEIRQHDASTSLELVALEKSSVRAHSRLGSNGVLDGSDL